MTAPLSFEDAVLRLRSQQGNGDLLTDSYLDEDVGAAAERFLASSEFAELRRMLGAKLEGAAVVDLGAGTGVASYAFARSGASLVYAVEPDESRVVGRGAIATIAGELPIELVDAFGEALPLPDGSVDIVYARQVLHHARDLNALVRECARVLKPGGLFVACREHVVSDEDEKRTFLAGHPIHVLTRGEGAHTLAEYRAAIRGAGLTETRVMGPLDSIITAFPFVRTQKQLEALPAFRLERRFGAVGRFLAQVPAARALVRRRLEREAEREPGRLYAFVAQR